MKKNLSQKEIASIYKVSIDMYNNNMKVEGRSKTPEFYANQLMAQYDNAIIEDGLVTAYYRNGYGCVNIPSIKKYL